jgi:DNA-3-methyladenine glycosylase I
VIQQEVRPPSRIPSCSQLAVTELLSAGDTARLARADPREHPFHCHHEETVIVDETEDDMTEGRAIVVGEDGVARCWWADSAPEYRAYHDTEWGFPVSDDVQLFEKLSLEGFQAGLSWLTILRKREAFRRAFSGFQIDRVARFGERDVTRLLADGAIVRNRAKIEAVINNARRAVELVRTEGSLGAYVWSWEPEARRGGLDRAALAELAATTESKALAKDLKRRGWRFVGPTTVYAFMQAMGLVNDHVDGCETRAKVETARERFNRP